MPQIPGFGIGENGRDPGIRDPKRIPGFAIPGLQSVQLYAILLLLLSECRVSHGKLLNCGDTKLHAVITSPQ